MMGAMSSARAAQGLLGRGWRSVRPLLGGVDAWTEAGYPTGEKIAGSATTASPRP